MKKHFLIHPFLFAIFPILSLYNYNKDLANFSDIYIPVLLSIFFVMVVFFILQKVFKNIVKTSIATTFFFFLFFIFGHFAIEIPEISIGGKLIKNSDYYMSLMFSLAIYIPAVLLLRSSKKKFTALSQYLFIVGIILMVFPVLDIIYYHFHSEYFIDKNEIENFVGTKNNKNFPDIYYLIFDGHGRSDTLKKYYDYDNSDFIDSLKEKDFFVAEQSVANYPQTYLSMASSLNFGYLDYVTKQIGENSNDRSILRSLLKDNKVYDILEANGYKFVALPDTWTGTYKNIKADMYLSEKRSLGEFNEILLNTTPLRIFLKSNYKLSSQKNKILFLFDKIPEIAKIESPTFTYVHCLSPHPPFLFDEEGNLLEDIDEGGLDGDHYFKRYPGKDDYIKKSKGQVAYIDKKIEQLVDDILKNSKEPPIIIIQSDHGTGLMTEWENPEKTDMKERFGILNAYYAPSEIKNELYSSISPVNTFRIIFNNLFDMNLEILDDRSYFATWSHPYKFIDVTDRVE